LQGLTRGLHPICLHATEDRRATGLRRSHSRTRGPRRGTPPRKVCLQPSCCRAWRGCTLCSPCRFVERSSIFATRAEAPLRQCKSRRNPACSREDHAARQRLASSTYASMKTTGELNCLLRFSCEVRPRPQPVCRRSENRRVEGTRVV